MNRYVQSLGLLLLFAGSAEAQPATLYDVVWLVQPGDTLTVTDNAGVRVRGKLVQMSPTSLVLDVSRTLRQFQESDIHEIKRRGDSLKNGALIGFAIGGAFAAYAVTAQLPSDDYNGDEYIAFVPLLGGIGAAIGVGIDALIRGDRVLYARPQASQPSVSVAPIVRRGQKGVLMSVRLPT